MKRKVWNKGLKGKEYLKHYKNGRASNRISEEKEQKIIQLYKQGLDMRGVGKIVGINFSTVARVLKRNNMKVRTSKWGVYERTDKWKKDLSIKIKKIALKGKDNPAYIDGLAQQRKNYKRRRLGCFKITNNPFPKQIRIEWHHINNLFVIPIPNKTHKFYYTAEQKQHRIKCNERLNQLGFNLNVFMEVVIQK